MSAGMEETAPRTAPFSPTRRRIWSARLWSHVVCPRFSTPGYLGLAYLILRARNVRTNGEQEKWELGVEEMEPS